MIFVPQFKGWHFLQYDAGQTGTFDPSAIAGVPVLMFYLKMCAGGGGSSAMSIGGTQGRAGGGGGGYKNHFYCLAGETFAYSVGIGGLGGSYPNGNGTTGGATEFAGIACLGGTGGIYNGAVGVGGACGGGLSTNTQGLIKGGNGYNSALTDISCAEFFHTSLPPNNFYFGGCSPLGRPITTLAHQTVYGCGGNIQHYANSAGMNGGAGVIQVWIPPQG